VGGASIAYVQGAYAVSAAAGTLTATYSLAQAAGDLNVICIGWSGSANHITAVTDSKGNAYVAAVGPTTNSNSFAAVIYYAKNIAAAAASANAVTVTFNTSVNFPDVRIVEYRGLSTTAPFDVGIGAGGNSTAQNSGSVMTTNANDLLVGSSFIANVFAAVGSGYTKRVLSNPNSDLVEDEVVTATGSYSATATQNTTGWWLMQLAAFRAASGGSSSSSSSSSSGGSSSSGSSGSSSSGSSSSSSGSSSSGSSSGSSSSSGSGSSGSGSSSGSSGSSGAGISTTYIYDANGHLTSITTASGGSVQFGYDPAGNVISIQTSQ
jgi:YD repeat-containing protein